MLRSMFAPLVVTDDGHTFELVTDGWAVGFRVTSRTGTVRYLYLNPSSTSDTPDTPNVFLYLGDTGSPSIDPTVIYVDIE